MGGVEAREESAVGLSPCRSFGGVKTRGVDPGEPSWAESGMDVVDNEEVGEGGSGGATGSTGNMEGPRISRAYSSPSLRISMRREVTRIGCLRRNFASLMDLPTLEMIRGSMVIATFASLVVYPQIFPLPEKC